MKQLVIGILIALFVAAGMVGAYLLLGSDSEELTDNSAVSDGSTAVFSPQSNEGVSFTATLDGKTADGERYSAVIRHDAMGNTHYQGDFGDSSLNMYLINGRNILCSNGTCILTPTPESTPISSDQYKYDEEDYNDFREIAEYLGREDCKSGTCDVWQINESGATGKLFINSEGRVDRAEWMSDDGEFSIDYEYTNVTIEEPENVQQIPS